MFFKEINQILKPGYLPLETGYYRLPNGQMHVAVLTQMPGCKAEMIEWWFGHVLDNDSFKMWHPKSHLSLEWDKLHSPGHYIGSGCIVKVRMGGRNKKLRIHFHEPSEFLDTSLFEKGKVRATICANIYEVDKVPRGRMVHLVRDTEFDSEIRGRFWLYNSSEEEGGELMQQCIEKMSHLAAFLPNLYASKKKSNLKKTEKEVVVKGIKEESISYKKTLTIKRLLK